MNPCFRITIPFLLLVMAAMPACDDKKQSTRPTETHDDHGHDHDSAAHAHGHDEEDEEEHDDHGHHDEDEESHDEHSDEVTLTEDAIRRSGIRVERAEKKVLVGNFVAPARVSFNLERMAHVGTPISGRVAQIKVRLGDTVKQDDVLMVIDSPDLGEAQSDFLQKRTAVATAGPAVELARSAYERAEQLHKDIQGISLTEVQRREAEWRAAQGTLHTAEAALKAAENRLHPLGMSGEAVKSLTDSGEIDPRSAIRAPMAGEVIDREATLGELVGPDREALVVLADMSTLWVLADVPEAVLHDVAVGSRAQLVAAGARNQVIDGTVAYVLPQVKAETRSGSVRIEVDGASSGLRPGMFVQARIDLVASEKGNAPVLAIPEVAVQIVEGDTSVFVPVEGEANTFARRPVKVGQQVGRMVPVLDGLREGEPVVVSGSFILKAELGKAGAAHEH